MAGVIRIIMISCYDCRGLGLYTCAKTSIGREHGRMFGDSQLLVLYPENHTCMARYYAGKLVGNWNDAAELNTAF